MLATAERPPVDDRIVDPFLTETIIECRRMIDGDPMALEGYVGDYIEAEFEYVENQVAPGHIEVPAKSQWAKTFSKCDTENIFIHALVNGDWWTGRVDRVRKVRKGKKRTVVAELVSDWVWLEAMLAWSAPGAPLWAQWPKKNVKVMATDTMIRSYLFETIFRLQAFGSGLHRFPVGFFQNPAENWWSMNMADWMQPCVVLPSNPFYDSTRWNTLMAKMTSLDTLFTDVLYDEHLVLVAKAFVPGRDAQPSPYINLTKPCIYFDIIDKRGATGETDTIVRGLFNTIIDTIDPIVDSVINTFTADSKKYSLSEFFGTDPADPWVIFADDGEGIIDSETIINSPQAHTAIVGGKSPEWLNEGIKMVVNAGIQGLLSAVGIGFLGDLIGGELSDVLLAFQEVTDERRRMQFGVFSLPEVYESSATAYTFDSAQALRKLIWETRPYRTFKATLAGNRLPFIPLVHFGVGDPVGWEDEDDLSIHTDYVRRIVVTINRKMKQRFAITVGDEQGEKDPMTKTIERVSKMKEAFDFWTLSDN